MSKKKKMYKKQNNKGRIQYTLNSYMYTLVNTQNWVRSPLLQLYTQSISKSCPYIHLHNCTQSPFQNRVHISIYTTVHRVHFKIVSIYPSTQLYTQSVSKSCPYIHLHSSTQSPFQNRIHISIYTALHTVHSKTVSIYPSNQLYIQSISK